MNVRKGKIRRGLQKIADLTSEGERVNAVKLTNVSALEILAIRPFLTKALNEFYRLSMGEFAAQQHRPNAPPPHRLPASSPHRNRRPASPQQSLQSRARACAGSAADLAREPAAGTRRLRMAVAGRRMGLEPAAGRSQHGSSAGSGRAERRASLAGAAGRPHCDLACQVRAAFARRFGDLVEQQPPLPASVCDAYLQQAGQAPAAHLGLFSSTRLLLNS